MTAATDEATAIPPRLAVAICTHNPRPAFLRETIAALREQSLPTAAWDLLVVDNASSAPVGDWLDLTWHPRWRIEREEHLGTAYARRHALESLCRHELLLFVDDDNLLAPDYLEYGLSLAQQHPRLGCWGGQLIARYDRLPPAWLVPYQKYLAIWEFARATISARVDTYDVCPPTAGCFIREPVRRRYLEMLAADPRRLALGAKGEIQVRGEDLDLVLTAIDLGLELGRFPDLRLIHCMPASRLETNYLAGLLEGTRCGTGLLEYLRSARQPDGGALSWAERLLARWRSWRLPPPLGQFYAAELRGARKAMALIRQWEADSARLRR
jgi:GT2 family glycosyltransferase